MSLASRLAAFAAVLALASGGAALAGAAIDPEGADEPTGADMGHRGDPAGAGEHAGGGEHADDARAAPAATSASGLAVSDAGRTLEVEKTRLARGLNRLTFRITGAGDDPLTRFERIHDRRMHVIVVRRDTRSFQHVHPTTNGAGTWTVDVDLPRAGAYRLYADFQTAGEQHTLATDVFVPGDFAPRPLPEPQTVADDGGYDVTLDAGDPHAGDEAELTFRVTRDGRPVARLQDYLGAKGHLVALRDGDLAYLHVHPTAGDPGEVPFAATFPTPGTYRLFLQFRVDGEVRTVDYTLDVHR